jgi:methyl-accepting chemotaxis protein
MKTGFRVSLITISLALLLGCTAGVFLLAIAPADRLRAEYDSFSRLDSSLAALEVELFRGLGFSADSSASARITDAFKGAESAFDEVASVSTGNRDTSAAIAEIGKARAIISSGVADLQALLSGPVEGGTLSDYAGHLSSLSSTIDSVRTRASKILPVVSRDIHGYLTLSFVVSGLIIVCAWILGLLAVWLYSRSFSRVTRRFTVILDDLADGKINTCLDGAETGSGDELLERMSRFVTSLRALGDSLTREVATNVESSTKLSDSLGNTSSTFEVVDGFIENIQNEVKVLEKQVNIVKTGLERVTSGLNHLDRSIGNQRDVVDGSMVSVDGMIASIGEMAEAATNDEKVVRELVDSSESSQTLFSATYRKITMISDSVSRINGMVEVIENISEQTSMLAMNAAIEAAHAGDAGKGFAVVAEEMTKLAEASSDSSREIAESIGEIIENITAMASSSGSLDLSFGKMTADISRVHETITKFSTGLVASSKDGQGVRETMNALKEVTDVVTRDSGNMAEGAGAIAASMTELDMISSRVFDGITAMSLMLDGLKDVMAEFKTLAESMKSSGLSMRAELLRLK